MFLKLQLIHEFHDIIVVMHRVVSDIVHSLLCVSLRLNVSVNKWVRTRHSNLI